MEVTIANPQAPQTKTNPEYSSRPGALAWCFRKSRDRWKAKYKELKVTVKQHSNRVADLTKSREQWRLKAATAVQRVTALEAEAAALRTRIATLEEEKKTHRR